jgi:hypothetical protein
MIRVKVSDPSVEDLLGKSVRPFCRRSTVDD